MSDGTASDVRSPITGRVAQILNARELVINIGKAAGVVKGMKFKVLADTPLEVRDPGTGDLLDEIDREKTRVEAVEVRDKITICRTFRVITTGGVDLRALASIASAFQRAESRPETLSLEDSSLPPPLPEAESYVKANDRVEELTSTP